MRGDCTEEQFVTQVRSQIQILDSRDEGMILSVIKQQWSAGYTVTDAVKYHKCFEECGSLLPEDQAIREAAAIATKYRSSKEKV